MPSLRADPITGRPTPGMRSNPTHIAESNSKGALVNRSCGIRKIMRYISVETLLLFR